MSYSDAQAAVETRATGRIGRIELDQGSITYRSPEIEHERAIAISDLLEDNQFQPVGAEEGPYHLLLSVADNRLTMRVSRMEQDGGKGEELAQITVPITPFRRIIKDYFLICESYFDAIKQGSVAHIEAIDMGRRGVHNEGSELLTSLLSDRVSFDFETARRLFTLICVLHIK